MPSVPTTPNARRPEFQEIERQLFRALELDACSLRISILAVSHESGGSSTYEPPESVQSAYKKELLPVEREKMRTILRQVLERVTLLIDEALTDPRVKLRLSEFITLVDEFRAGRLP